MIKSEQMGEMHTEAPESTINMILLGLREKHFGSSKVGIKALYACVFILLISI